MRRGLGSPVVRDTPESLPYGRLPARRVPLRLSDDGRADAAAAVLRRTVERAARAGIDDLRDARRVKRWLFTEARTCAPSRRPPRPLDVPGTGARARKRTRRPRPPRATGARFADLPEDERGALILFYLFLFDPAELAEVLEIPPAELAPLLLRGRALLGSTPGGVRALFAAAPREPVPRPPRAGFCLRPPCPASACSSRPCPPWLFPASDKHLARLACCRPDGEPLGCRRTRDALGSMADDPALQDAFDSSGAFDAPLAARGARRCRCRTTFETDGRGRPAAGRAKRDELLARDAAPAGVLGGAAGGGVPGRPGRAGRSTSARWVSRRRQRAAGRRTWRSRPAWDRSNPSTPSAASSATRCFCGTTWTDYDVPEAFTHDDGHGYRVFAKNDRLVAQVQVRDGDATWCSWCSGRTGRG